MPAALTHPASPARTLPCCVLALDIGGTKVAGGCVLYEIEGETPRLALEDRMPTQAARGGADVLERVSGFARTLLNRAREAGLDPCAIGVSTAGRVDSAQGSIAYANELMPGWTGQPIAARLAQACSLPVVVLNDVQAHALGEARWGAGRGVRTCIVIAAGTGLGAGIIADGRLLRGAHGFAGEVGAMMNPFALASDDRIEASILESVAAGSGIEARYAEATGAFCSGEQVSLRADEGDPEAARAIDRAGYALGCALASWTEMLDPELAIISGSVTKAGPRWKEALARGFAEHTTPAHADLPIASAYLGDSAPLVGAAEFALDTGAVAETPDPSAA